MISSRVSPSIWATTAVEATFTSTTWSRPTLLKLFSSAMQPWISWALIIAVRTSFTVRGFLPGGHGVARQPVGGGEDAAQVVRRVAPFGGEPGVVEVEPADHGADVEGGLHRVHLVGRAGHLRAVGHDGAGDDGPQHLGAGGVLEGLEAAAEGVHEAVAGGLVGLRALHLVLDDVVGDVDEDLVGLGADVADVGGHGVSVRVMRETPMDTMNRIDVDDGLRAIRPSPSVYPVHPCHRVLLRPTCASRSGRRRGPRAGVVGARADDLAVDALLDHVRASSRRCARSRRAA